MEKLIKHNKHGDVNLVNIQRFDENTLMFEEDHLFGENFTCFKQLNNSSICFELRESLLTILSLRINWICGVLDFKLNLCNNWTIFFFGGNNQFIKITNELKDETFHIFSSGDFSINRKDLNDEIYLYKPNGDVKIHSNSPTNEKQWQIYPFKMRRRQKNDEFSHDGLFKSKCVEKNTILEESQNGLLKCKFDDQRKSIVRIRKSILIENSIDENICNRFFVYSNLKYFLKT